VNRSAAPFDNVSVRLRFGMQPSHLIRNDDAPISSASASMAFTIFGSSSTATGRGRGIVYGSCGGNSFCAYSLPQNRRRQFPYAPARMRTLGVCVHGLSVYARWVSTALCRERAAMRACRGRLESLEPRAHYDRSAGVSRGRNLGRTRHAGRA
jgi:hypothetical protein